MYLRKIITITTIQEKTFTFSIYKNSFLAENCPTLYLENFSFLNKFVIVHFLHF